MMRFSNASFTASIYVITKKALPVKSERLSYF